MLHVKLQVSPSKPTPAVPELHDTIPPLAGTDNWVHSVLTTAVKNTHLLYVCIHTYTYLRTCTYMVTYVHVIYIFIFGMHGYKL